MIYQTQFQVLGNVVKQSLECLINLQLKPKLRANCINLCSLRSDFLTPSRYFCWNLINCYGFEEKNNQYLLVIFHIGDVSFNTFESAMEGMGWKHVPLDVINAVRFVVVPR